MNPPPINIRLPRPHLAQQRVISEARRFNVLVCGRRWGKTRLGEDRATFGVLRGKPIGWFAPTYKYLLDPWRDLCRILGPLAVNMNKTDHRIECATGGSLEFWSLDRGDAGRSRAYADIIVDEAAMVMDLRETFESALQPTLMDFQGGAWFLSTPKGYDDFHGLYERGQDREERFRDWNSWRMPSASNPFLLPSEIDVARSTTDPRFFAQEYEASFEEMTGRVYIRFDRELNVRDDLTDTGGDLLVGMDFNVAPMSACIAVRAGDELHFIDEIELMNSDTAEMCTALKQRYPGRRITVFPDPSGCARKTSAPVGQTDFTIIRSHGFGLVAPNAAPPVVDRINEVNALCCNAEGRRRMFLHPRCRQLRRGLTQLLYKDGQSVVDKASGLDHMPDSAGYLVHSLFPIGPRGGTATVRWG